MHASGSHVTAYEDGCKLVSLEDLLRHIQTRQLELYPGIALVAQHLEGALSQVAPKVQLPAQLPSGTSAGRVVCNVAEPPDGSISQLVAAVGALLFSLLPSWWPHLALPHQVWSLRARATPNSAAACAGTHLAWHTRQSRLALAHTPTDTVAVYDVHSVPSSGLSSSSSSSLPMLDEPSLVLVHELQRGVASIAWRPTHCTMLAAGCAGGVLLWALGRQPLASAGFQRCAPPAAPAWCTFLVYRGCESVTSLAWSPDGGLLAGASTACSRVMVWDAGLGVGSALRLGLGGTSLLRWSPRGDYLFAAGTLGRFHLWETSRWRRAAWDTPAGGQVTAAAWAPDGRVLLLALSRGAALVALYLVANAPSLTEQMLPVELPGVSDLENNSSGAAGRAAAPSCICDAAWDPSGERLAVALQEPHPQAGSVAIYSTRYAPVVTLHLIGFAQPFATAGPRQRQEPSAPSSSTDARSGSSSNGGGGGSGSANSGSSPPCGLRLAFAHHMERGALLSVQRLGEEGKVEVANIPLHF